MVVLFLAILEACQHEFIRAQWLDNCRRMYAVKRWQSYRCARRDIHIMPMNCQMHCTQPGDVLKNIHLQLAQYPKLYGAACFEVHSIACTVGPMADRYLGVELSTLELP